MSMPMEYPASRNPASPRIDLADPAERSRLGPAGLRAFFKLVSIWKLGSEEGRALLGGISNGTWYKWRSSQAQRLDVDTLTRISLLISIYKSLHLLHSNELADEWPRLANTNRLFDGATPVEAMIAGGIPMMLAVRRLLDARRGGV